MRELFFWDISDGILGADPTFFCIEVDIQQVGICLQNIATVVRSEQAEYEIAFSRVRGAGCEEITSRVSS